MSTTSNICVKQKKNSQQFLLLQKLWKISYPHFFINILKILIIQTTGAKLGLRYFKCDKIYVANR